MPIWTLEMFNASVGQGRLVIKDSSIIGAMVVCTIPAPKEGGFSGLNGMYYL
jgi:hypothetical protein